MQQNAVAVSSSSILLYLNEWIESKMVECFPANIMLHQIGTYVSQSLRFAGILYLVYKDFLAVWREVDGAVERDVPLGLAVW
jgi:hypothetical protein